MYVYNIIQVNYVKPVKPELLLALDTVNGLNVNRLCEQVNIWNKVTRLVLFKTMSLIRIASNS